MRKIPTLFKREHDDDPSWRGPRLVTDVVRLGCEWVLLGEGRATEKFDGTACMFRSGVLYRRHCRKPTRKAREAHNRIVHWPWFPQDYPPAPGGWEPCDVTAEPTGLWPGWVPVGEGPEDKYHREARDTAGSGMPDGTYELVGPRVQSNPYALEHHVLWRHGAVVHAVRPRTYERIRAFLEEQAIEGIVFHHEDGRMAKIKRRDFGMPWPRVLEL